ncbi:MAG: ABC transporter permease [Gemmataceae bacterium]
MSTNESLPVDVASPAWSPLRLLTGPVLGLIAVLAVFSILLGARGEEGALGSFASLSNVQILVYSNTHIAVLALGMLLIMISGGIDLSIGSVVALVTVTTMYMFKTAYAWNSSTTIASLMAVSAGLGTGAACGLINGLVITRLGVAPFVATLGMLNIARGLAQWIAKSQPMPFPRGTRPGWVSALADTYPKHGLFNPGFWSLVVLAFLVALLLRRTILGRYCYAIGSNEATARLCGVGIDRTKVTLYTIAGLLSGWAGILLFAQIDGGDPTVAVGMELDVIAAVVIGGASLAGGVGTVSGTLVGVLILSILFNGVNRFHVPIQMQLILSGVIIIANTALSRWRQKT